MGIFEETIKKITPQDSVAREAAVKRIESLTMPRWALGRVLDLAVDLCGMNGKVPPSVGRKTITVMAGDHGVTCEGVSLYPKEVTAQMIANFLAGGAGVNAMAKLTSAKVIVVDMGVDAKLDSFKSDSSFLDRKIGMGTANIALGPAMTRDDAVKCLETGIEIANSLSQDTDMFGVGDMGIGNTTPSAAVAATICGKSASEVTGTGTGLDENGWKKKVEVVERAIMVNKADPEDGVDTLSKLGGYEIGGITGMILGAAALKKPVLIDGFISTAAALIAWRICPASAEYMISSHQSAEPGSRFMLEALGKKPLLDLGMRLGEGSGAALAMTIVDAAVNVITDMATFDEAAVSDKE